MDNVRLYLPIQKIDRETRMCWGYASTPTRDLDGEVIELEAIKNALPGYMEWRNVREMHRPSAVGVTKEANVDDKGLYIGARIVDDDAWKKVIEEVYKGFSIGGDVTGRKGSTITGLELLEISLVDRPANSDCRIDVIKVAGMADEIQEPILNSAVEHGIVLAPEEVGLFGRLLAKLAGRRVEKGGDAAGDGKKPYGDVEYADPGYREGKKRYPIDTEEHIRAAWSYIHHEKNANEYTAEQVAAIKRRIVAAWKKKIDEKGPPASAEASAGKPEAKAAEPEAEKSQGGDAHESEPVDDRDEVQAADGPPAGRDGFSRPAKVAAGKAITVTVGKGGGGGAAISAGATKMAEAEVSKRAASGRHDEHMRKAAHHIEEAHKCCGACMAAMPEDAEKVAGGGSTAGGAVAKASKAREHLERAMEHHVLAHHHLAAAGGHKGEPGEQMGDAEAGIYKPEQGLTPLSQRQMTEGEVPAYEVGKPYPGKAAEATLTKREAEALIEAAFLKGKVEALEKMPASPKARLFAVPRGSLPVSEAEEPSAIEKLFKGVNLDAVAPAERQAAGAKLIGNMIANSATFARPVIGDAAFRGGAGR